MSITTAGLALQMILCSRANNKRTLLLFILAINLQLLTIPENDSFPDPAGSEISGITTWKLENHVEWFLLD